MPGALPCTLAAMGLVRIVVDGGYSEVDQEMSARGYMRTIPDDLASKERLYMLPAGTYWMAEPTVAEKMLADALSAAKSAGKTGARVLASAGLAAWDGLTPISGE